MCGLAIPRRLVARALDGGASIDADAWCGAEMRARQVPDEDEAVAWMRRALGRVRK